jgi:hypothetical protein
VVRHCVRRLRTPAGSVDRISLVLPAPARHRAHRALIASGLLIALAASTLFTGLLYFSSSRVAIVSGAFAGSSSLATLWFRFTAQPTRVSALTESKRLIALLLPIALLLWSARHWLKELAVTVRVRFGLCVGYCVATVLVSLGAFQLAYSAANTDPEHHLRLVWTGLDVIELLGLAWTAWCLKAGSRLVVFAAPFTAAFLVSDAWTNVIATTGEGRLAANGMAVIELSLASLSVWVAARFGVSDAAYRAGSSADWTCRRGCD